MVPEKKQAKQRGYDTRERNKRYNESDFDNVEQGEFTDPLLGRRTFLKVGMHEFRGVVKSKKGLKYVVQYGEDENDKDELSEEDIQRILVPEEVTLVDAAAPTLILNQEGSSSNSINSKGSDIGGGRNDLRGNAEQLLDNGWHLNIESGNHQYSGLTSLQLSPVVSARRIAALQHLLSPEPLPLMELQRRALEFVPVDDASMEYYPNDVVVTAVAKHFKKGYKAKGWPSLLLYGHPGCGKTRILREIVMASQDPQRPLYTMLHSKGVDLSEWLVLTVTFSTISRASTRDQTLYARNISLPAWARLYFGYCSSFYHLDDFTKFSQALVKDINRIDAPGAFNLSSMIDKIRNSSGKKHVLLLIDENLRLSEFLSNATDFEDVLSVVNRVQDRKENTGKLTRVIWTGLREGPWTDNESVSSRLIIRHLLPPLPAQIVDSLIRQAGEAGLQLLSQWYVAKQAGNPAQLISKYLCEFSMGLPRAVQVIRNELRDLSTCVGLVEFSRLCSSELWLLYRSEPDDEVLCLALLGKKVWNVSSASASSQNVMALAVKLQTDMSKGRCMLVERGPYSNNLVVPPLRLLGANVVGGALSRPHFKHLSNLLNLATSLNPRLLEEWLVQHELLMRSVRSWMTGHPDVASAVSAPNYKSLTLFELYYGSNNETPDIDVNWQNPALNEIQFDFTVALRYKRDLTRFPPYSKAAEYANTLIYPNVTNQKGFEFALILMGSDRQYVVVAVQCKFTEVDNVQEAAEISEAAEKTVEALTTDEVDGVALNWPRDRIVTLFITNRPRRNYRVYVENQNVVFVSKDTLQTYLGPTVWAMFQASEALSGLQMVGSGTAEKDDR